VKDGNAHFSTLVDIGVPHFRHEGHLRGHVGEVGRELELGLEEASLIEGGL
jgi:hypothetical protein